MALRKRLNKKGGCEYASVSDNYNLLTDTIKQIKGGNKKGGSKYASLSDNYNLLEDAIKQIKGGNKNNRKGGCTSYADVNSSYMISETKTGGNRHRKGGDLWSTGTDIINKLTISAPQATSIPVATAPVATAPVAQPQAVVTKGGNRRGGCGCSNSQRMRKGHSLPCWLRGLVLTHSNVLGTRSTQLRPPKIVPIT